MRTALVLALMLAAVVPAAAALPRAGTLVPGRSLGGIRLGEPAAQVQAALGAAHGVCRGCKTTTWYFTYRAFDRHGLAVELTRGRVSAVYTVWRPGGWSAPRGLRLGADEAQVAKLGHLFPVVCSDYEARIRDYGQTRTVYYILRGRLWGFGLMRGPADPCR